VPLCCRFAFAQPKHVAAASLSSKKHLLAKVAHQMPYREALSRNGN
jgi:hypothetical protein